MTLGPMEGNRPILTRWVRRTQDSLRAAQALHRPFFECSAERFGRTEWLVGQLAIRCTLTSDSILLLVSELKFWDAEVLARSVLEGTFRLAFLCEDIDEQGEERTHQFLDVIPEIARLRRHSRLEGFFSQAPDPEHPKWRPFRDLLLTDAEKQELRMRYPRSTRSKLEQAWSLPGLVAELEQSGQLVGIEAMLHTYGMSSSLAHLDGDAILTMSEREGRSQERIEAIELAHGARLLSDVISYANLRALAVLNSRQLDLDAWRSLQHDTRPLLIELEGAATSWSSVEYGAD